MDQSNNTGQSSALQALENLRKRLLDLTARNRLLNFRHTKNGSLRIINTLPNQLVEILLSEKEIRFEAISEPSERELIAAGYLEFNAKTQRLEQRRNDPNAAEWAKHLGFETSYEMPELSSEFNLDFNINSNKSIQILLYPYEMETRLKALLHTSECAIQEMGANILYLAIGFLEWYESNISDVVHIAPLFLVPVRLRKGRLNPTTSTYEYTLSYSGEDIIPNLSLREKLRADFAMALPDLDENTVPEVYLNEVKALIEDNQPRWQVRRYITLTLLNFSKLLMYLDLDPRHWPPDANIIDHPVVSRFLCGYGQESDLKDYSFGDLGFGEEYLIDENDKIHKDYPLIDDADSSQHSALIDAVDGKNLVIEGPPGTGKSQTITNLIAAAMARGKKVLFVAEKLAALEVVRRRLDSAGIGEFCLELHSHKSQKRKVLDEVNGRLMKHRRYRKPRDIDVDIARYEELKTMLNKHVVKINRQWKNTGKTLHEILMAATRYRNMVGFNPNCIHLQGYDGNNYDSVAQRRNEDRVQAYRKVYQAIEYQLGEDAVLQSHPWYGVRNSNLQIFDQDQVKEYLEAWQVSIKALHEQRQKISRTIDCNELDVAGDIKTIQVLLKDIENITALNGDEILDLLPVLRGEILKKNQNYLSLFENIQASYATLAKNVGLDVLQDLSIADKLLSAKQQLKQLVRHDVAMGELAKAINQLTVIQDQIYQLDEPLQGVISALGEPAAKHINVSKSGLIEFKTVIDLITSLNPSLWKHRCELFDNEELDELLPRLRLDLKELLKLKDKFQDFYSFDAIPEENILCKLGTKLAAGGFFHWFKGEWRKARKQLLSYSVKPQVKFKVMLELLDDVTTYVRKRNNLEQSAVYKDAFGDYFQGLNTDLAMLTALRDWFKRVRQQYGVGFGQKVLIGDAILELPPSFAKAVRSLIERGLYVQLDNIFYELGKIEEVFTPVAELRNEDTLLSGEQGIIPRVLREVHETIRTCRPLANDDALSIADLVDRIEQIASLKQNIEKWQSDDVDNKLFHGRLCFQIGVSSDNSASISMLRNTLKLAAYIDGQLSNQALIDYIYKRPVNNTFTSLSNHAKDLRSAVEAEKSNYENFAELVRLDPTAWMQGTGELINNLITRNQTGIDNIETLSNWLDYLRERNQLDALGIAPLADAVEKSEIQIEMIEYAYQAAIYDALAREILLQDPELGRFSGHSQKALQEKFRDYDNKLKKLQCEQIAWKIDQTQIPTGNMTARVSQRTERTLLEHECGKKTRHIPIRQLIRRAGNALVALKPCFMMGPMSVAQYLAPDNISFDLVVMDEAS